MTAGRREEVARAAARARWHHPLVLDRAPRDRAELLSYVVNYGSSVTTITSRCCLENVVLRAVEEARRDSVLARMLPVFLWRARGRLDFGRLVRGAVSRGSAAALGAMLEVTAAVASRAPFRKALEDLLLHAHPERPEQFFASTNAFEARVSEARTPTQTRAWGFLMNMPIDSFSSHFAKRVVAEAT